MEDVDDSRFEPRSATDAPADAWSLIHDTIIVINKLTLSAYDDDVVSYQ